MGQIAEDMEDGTCCDLCGCYFRKIFKEELFTHNRPATCPDCWDELTPDEKKHHQRCDGGITTF